MSIRDEFSKPIKGTLGRGTRYEISPSDPMIDATRGKRRTPPAPKKTPKQTSWLPERREP